MFSCANISKTTYKPPAVPDEERKQSRKLKVTGRLRVAIDAMVWIGDKRDDAAARAGLSVQALYLALRKPHVKAFYLNECEILRTSGRARRIHRLEEIAEATSNLNASVQAIRTLDAVDGANNPVGSGASQAPGFTIVLQQIVQSPGPQPQIVQSDDANPLISHDRDSLHQNVDR